MVPQIDNLTHKLDIGNCKNEINMHDILSGNKIKCDLCEYTASKSTVLKRLVTIKHNNEIPMKFYVNYVIQFVYPELHLKNTAKL